MDETIRVLERRVRESPDDAVAERALELARCRVGQAPRHIFEWKTVNPNDPRFTHPNIAFDMLWLRRRFPELDRVLRPGATVLVWGVRPSAPATFALDFELPPRYAFVQPHRLVVA